MIDNTYAASALSMSCVRNLQILPCLATLHQTTKHNIISCQLRNIFNNNYSRLRPNAPTLSRTTINGGVISVAFAAVSPVSVRNLFSSRRLRPQSPSAAPFTRRFAFDYRTITDRKMACTNPKQVCIIGSGNW